MFAIIKWRITYRWVYAVHIMCIYIYTHMCIDRLISSRLSFPCCGGNGLILPPEFLICLAEDCNFAANGHKKKIPLFFSRFFKLCGIGAKNTPVKSNIAFF